MIRTGVYAGAATVLSVAALAVASMSGAANAAMPHGFKPSFFKHAGHHHAFRHHRFDGLYGGYVLGYGGEPLVASLPLEVTPMIPAPPALTCSRTRQTVTVPSENGGTRDITVTRC